MAVLSRTGKARSPYCPKFGVNVIPVQHRCKRMKKSRTDYLRKGLHQLTRGFLTCLFSPVDDAITVGLPVPLKVEENLMNAPSFKSMYP